MSVTYFSTRYFSTCELQNTYVYNVSELRKTNKNVKQLMNLKKTIVACLKFNYPCTCLERDSGPCNLTRCRNSQPPSVLGARSYISHKLDLDRKNATPIDYVHSLHSKSPTEITVSQSDNLRFRMKEALKRGVETCYTAHTSGDTNAQVYKDKIL